MHRRRHILRQSGLRCIATSCGAVLATIACLPRAQAGDLVTAPEASVYIAPPQYDGQFSNVAGDASVRNPGWHLVQWGNPNPLPGWVNASVGAGASWQFASATTRIAFYATPSGAGSQAILDQTYELAQNGAASAAPLPCGSEFDLFLEANSAAAAYKDPSGAVAAQRFQTSAPLSQLSEVSASFGLDVNYESVAQTCPVDYAAYEIAITLNSTRGPAMFFQIFLRDSRGPSADQDNTPCGGYPQGEISCFSTSFDRIATSQPPQSIYSGRVQYNFNFLARLLAAIGQTADTDPADWSITGMYFGNAVAGGAVSTARWDNMKLTAY